jgi:hypothetical protein
MRKKKVEDHGDFILGSVSPKEYKDTVAELNGSQMNRVFEFFKNASTLPSIARRPRGKVQRSPPSKRMWVRLRHRHASEVCRQRKPL